MLTKKLIADLVLLYEFSQQLLIFTSLVGNLKIARKLESNIRCASKSAHRSIPECTAELDSFQKDRLRLCKIEICPHGGIKSHSAKAGNGNLLAAKWKCRNHLGGFEDLNYGQRGYILPLDTTNNF